MGPRGQIRVGPGTRLRGCRASLLAPKCPSWYSGAIPVPARLSIWQPPPVRGLVRAEQLDLLRAQSGFGRSLHQGFGLLRGDLQGQVLPGALYFGMAPGVFQASTATLAARLRRGLGGRTRCSKT